MAQHDHGHRVAPQPHKAHNRVNREYLRQGTSTAAGEEAIDSCLGDSETDAHRNPIPAESNLPLCTDAAGWRGAGTVRASEETSDSAGCRNLGRADSLHLQGRYGAIVGVGMYETREGEGYEEWRQNQQRWGR